LIFRIAQLVTSRINNIYVKKGAELFFKSGEFVVDKTLQFLERTKASSHMKEAQKIAEKLKNKNGKEMKD
jgi:hypothetical protein